MAEPLSLYFDLDGNDAIDLDAMARAALEWSEAVRSIADHIDPSAVVDVRLASTTEGSLSLNNLVRWAREAKEQADPLTLKVIVVTATLFVIKEAGAWTVGSVMDWLTSNEAAPVTQGLSGEDMQQLARLVVKELDNRTAAERVRAVFREAGRDKVVTGVGATVRSGERPTVVVPRKAFSERTEALVDDEDAVERRTPTQRLTVTLIRPVLINDTGRLWRLRSFTGEFSATVKDEAFLDAAMSGRASLPLAEGVTLDVLLQATEEREGGAEGVWEPKSYAILKVYGFKAPVVSGSLPGFIRPQDYQPAEGDNDSEGDGRNGAK